MSSNKFSCNASSATYKFENVSTSTKKETKAFNFKYNLPSGDLIPFFIVKNISKLGGKNVVFVYIRFGEIKQNLEVQFKLSLVDVSGNRRFTQNGIANHNFSTGMLAINHDYLVDSASRLLQNDTLEVHCELNFVDSQTIDLSTSDKQAVSPKLLQDYDSLSESAKFSDVLLVVGKGRGKKEFHLHKNILSARSPVFGAMFEHKDTKEAMESRVVITDVSANVFQQFVRFLYAGKVTEMDKYASDLLIVADKYQMDCLKSLCSHYISSKLTTESVAFALALADLHNVSELKSQCIDYIVEHASEVMASENWKLIKDNNQLLVELFQNQSKKFKK